MNKIKIIVLVIVFSLFFVACSGGSSSGLSPASSDISDPIDPVDLSGRQQTLSASPESLSFTYGETNFKTSEVTSKGKGKYSASSNNKSVAEVYINSVGLVRVRPTGVGNAEVTIVRAKDSSYDSASQTIKISVNKQEQNLKVNLGTTTSDRWKLRKGTTATISIAARSVGGVGGDGDLVGSENDYSVKSSDTGVVTASVDSAGEIIITAKSIGDATVTVSRAGDGNYKEGNVVIFITVNEDATQAALNFTSTDGSTTDVTFDGYGETANKNITVTGGSAGDFSVKSSNTEIVTAVVDTNSLITITPRSSGTAVITVTRQGGDRDGKTYNPISKDIRVSINKPVAETLSADPSSFSSITYNKLDDTGDSVVSSSNSVGDYYIKSSKPDVATASITALGAITVLFEQAGTTDITITRAGDYGYRLSSAAIIDVTVDKATQTLIASPSSISATYVAGGDTTSITITGGEGTGSFDTPTSTPDNDVVDITRTSITPSGTLTVALNLGGTTNIIVLKRGDRNYEDSNPLEIAVTINKAPQTISIKGGELYFQLKTGTVAEVEILGAKGTGDYTVDSNISEAVASAGFDDNNLILTLGVIGRTVIEFSRNGDRNYEDSNSISITVAVTRQPNQTLTLGVTEVTGLTVTYQGTEVTGLTVTYQEIISADVSIGTDATGTGNAIEARSYDKSVARVAIIDATSIKITFVNAGKTTIFVSRAGNANFNPSRTLAIKVTVEQASQTIVVATTDVTLSYGETFETPLSGGLAGYEIESIEPEGVVIVSIGGGSNSDELIIKAIGSGTAEIKIFASGNDNYEQSESKLIKFTVNKAAQELTASPSTFSLVYNDTTTSALTTTASSFAGEGEYVVSNNTNIVTTDIDPKSGLLSLRDVGVTDTTVTITITKQQDIRYEAATIDIPIRVIKADQTLTSSITSVSFDKPGDTTTAIISGGFSGGVYKATSNNTNIVTVVITPAGSLSITAVAAGDAIVTIQRAGDENYNAAADLTIPVRVKTQQTLSSTGAVSFLKYKYKNSQSAGRITGGYSTAGYQSSSTPTGIVTTGVDANGVLFITTVSTGDTTISIYKEGDKDYNQSDPILLSLNVARGVVALEYEVINDATTIKYSYVDESIIKLRPPGVDPDSDFTYAVTTSDNIIDRGYKIGVRLLDDASIEVTTLNADPQPATIRVTRARTPYYEQATADIFVTVEKADLALAYDNPRPFLVYKIGGDATTVNLVVDKAIAGTNFTYTVTDITNKEYTDGILYPVLTAPTVGAVLRDGDIEVMTLNASPTPAIIRVTRTGDSNYNDATIDIFVTVNKANLALVYDRPHRVLTYKIGGDATTVNLVDPEIAGTNFTYRFTSITNNAYGEAEDAYIVLDTPSENTELPNGHLAVTALNASPTTVIIIVTRAKTRNYDAARAVIRVIVNKANLELEYDNPTRVLMYKSDGDATTVNLVDPEISGINFTYRFESITNNAYGEAEGAYTVLDTPIVNTELPNGHLTVTALNASLITATIIVIREETRNYNAADAMIFVTVERAILNNIAYKYSGTTISIPSSGAVAVNFATRTYIEPDEDVASRINEFTIVNSRTTPLYLDFSGGNTRTGIIGITSEMRDPVTLTLSWVGRNYEGNRTFTVTTLKVSPMFAYEPSTVELEFGGGAVDVEQTDESYISNQQILPADQNKFFFSFSGFYSDIISATANSSGTISITPKGLGTTTLRVTKTFIGSTTNYYNPVSTNITVKVSGVQLAHVATTDVQLGDYSGLTIIKDASLFIAGQPISVREVSDEGAFSSTIGGAITTLADSITSAKLGDKTYIFTANRQKSEVRVYSVENNGGLRHVTTVSDTPSLAIGGASALTTVVINSKLFLFVAGSSDNGVSAFRVSNNGRLTRGGSFTDGEDTDYTFKGASALTTATIDNNPYLFVAGKDENAVGVYELLQFRGSVSVPHANNNNIRNITGALSLATVSTDTKFFLYAAGSTGVKEVEVEVVSDGAIIVQGKQILTSSGEDTFVTVAQKGATNFLFAAYGNTLEAYFINDDGVRQTKATYTDDDNSKFGGVSSLTTAIIEDKLFLFVAGSSDNGVSVFEVIYFP